MIGLERRGEQAALQRLRHPTGLTGRRPLDLVGQDPLQPEAALCGQPAVADPVDAVLLDVSGVFVSAVLVRCLVDTTERAARAKKPPW